MHLIISKWLRRQKCRYKRKTMSQKEIEAKEETGYKSVFIHLNSYWIMPMFTLSSMSIVYTSSSDFFCTTCCIFSAKIALQL